MKMLPAVSAGGGTVQLFVIDYTLVSLESDGISWAWICVPIYRSLFYCTLLAQLQLFSQDFLETENGKKKECVIRDSGFWTSV
jgi:hypothetical protein